ncbi:MAG: amino acid adenylation domain-containing protein, partial [Caulobacteraceae bacterium]|nr:amino acid adenylation domain-containing protein [Caulobacteraceae bacterium]
MKYSRQSRAKSAPGQAPVPGEDGSEILPDPSARLPAGGGRLIQAWFLARAAETPDAVAITHEGVNWSYAQVERRSRALAHRLRRAGVTTGDRVAILAERGPELVWAILAVARLGGVFVVLDSAYPEGRLATLLEICAPKALLLAGGLSQIAIADRLAQPHGLPVAQAGPGSEGPPGEADNLDQASAQAPAYFLFTSGSTGHPKCVACSHIPLSRFVAWHADTFGLGRKDRFTMLSGLSHDPLLRDIFTPLSLGATLAIPRQSTITEPGALRPWLRQVGATVAHLTPAMGHLLAAGGARGPKLPELRHLFWGGDQLSPKLLDEVSQFAPGAAHTNFYGSSETPQAAGFHRHERVGDWPSVPVGRGSDGFQLLVVDEAKQPVGVGEPGEIAIRSNYLSLGYVEQGRLTPPDDRGIDAHGDRNIYYTGDRGVRLPDGNVLMVGRADDQIKIRGYRVDLSEITTALLALPGVRSAIALAIGEGPQKRIDAFIATAQPSPQLEANMAKTLAASLPGYMVPSRIWLFKDHLPLLPNGKVNRQALRAHAETEAAGPAASDIEGEGLSTA